MPAILNYETSFGWHYFRTAIFTGFCHFGKGGEHIELCNGTGYLLENGYIFGEPANELFIDDCFELEALVLAVQHLVFKDF